jgi:hypothetical protein
MSVLSMLMTLILMTMFLMTMFLMTMFLMTMFLMTIVPDDMAEVPRWSSRRASG